MKLGPMNRMKRPVQKPQKKVENTHIEENEPTAEQKAPEQPQFKPKDKNYSIYKDVLKNHERLRKKHADLGYHDTPFDNQKEEHKSSSSADDKTTD